MKKFYTELLKSFKKNYNELYEHKSARAQEYRAAVDAFDMLLKITPNFISGFARWRGDAVSSDREAAAFMFALNEVMESLTIQFAEGVNDEQ